MSEVAITHIKSPDEDDPVYVLATKKGATPDPYFSKVLRKMMARTGATAPGVNLDEVVGWVWVYPKRKDKATDKQEYYGSNLLVDEGHRRQGIATKMYEYTEKMLGQPLQKDVRQTPDAQAFWKAKKWDAPQEEKQEHALVHGKRGGMYYVAKSGAKIYMGK